MSVNVSPTAAREIHRIILENELDPAKVCLRVGVKGGGCSGFSYTLGFDDQISEVDQLSDRRRRPRLLGSLPQGKRLSRGPRGIHDV